MYMYTIPVNVLVFKTNIRFRQDVGRVAPLLDSAPGITRWNVDREDIDNVLRIESGSMDAQEVINLVRQAGYYCEELPD